MLDRSEDISGPSTHRTFSRALVLDRRHRPQRKDLSGARLLTNSVSAVQEAHEPLELAGLLQLDAEVASTLQELAQADRAGRVPVLPELIREILLQCAE